LYQLVQRQFLGTSEHISSRAELGRLDGEASKGAKVFGGIEEGEDGV
jgi:hypothetical protein